MAGKMSSKFVALSSLAVGAIYATGYSITGASATALAVPSAQQALPNAPSTGAGNQVGAPANGSSASSSGSQNSAAQGNGQAGNKPASSNATSSHQSSTGTSGTAKKSANTTTNSTKSSSISTSSSASKSSTSSAPKATTAPASPPVNTTQKYLDGTYNGSASNQIGSVAVAVSIKNGKIADVQITACDTHYPQAYIDPVLPQYVVSNQTTQIPIVSGATMSTADFYYAVVQALSQAQNPHYKG